MLAYEASLTTRSPFKLCGEFSTKYWKVTRGFTNNLFLLHLNMPEPTGYDFDLYVRIYTTSVVDDFV